MGQQYHTLELFYNHSAELSEAGQLALKNVHETIASEKLLDVTKCALTPKDVQLLGSFIARYPVHEELYGRGNKHFTLAETLTSFAMGLGEVRHSALKKINFQDCSIVASAGEALGRFCGKLPALEVANLSWNLQCFTTEGLTGLRVGLGETHGQSLKILNLSHCGLSHEVGEALGRLFAMLPALEEGNLSWNPQLFSSEGCKNVVQGLGEASIPSLKTLNLGYCDIAPDAHKAVGELFARLPAGVCYEPKVYAVKDMALVSWEDVRFADKPDMPDNPKLLNDGSSCKACGGRDKFLKWYVPFGAKEFEVFSSFEADQLNGTAMSFVLWAGGVMYHLLLDAGKKNFSFESSDPSWNDLTKKVPHIPSTLVAGTLQTLSVVRVNGVIGVSLNGIPWGVDDIPIKADITAVGWRPHRNTIKIESLYCSSPAGSLPRSTVPDR